MPGLATTALASNFNRRWHQTLRWHIPAIPINTGVTAFGGLPNINISGFEKLGSWHNRPQNWATPYYDIQDNISYLMGKHTFKFGGEFANIDITNAISDTGRGLIAFKGRQLTASHRL